MAVSNVSHLFLLATDLTPPELWTESTVHVTSRIALTVVWTTSSAQIAAATNHTAAETCAITTAVPACPPTSELRIAKPVWRV